MPPKAHSRDPAVTIAARNHKSCIHRTGEFGNGFAGVCIADAYNLRSCLDPMPRQKPNNVFGTFARVSLVLFLDRRHEHMLCACQEGQCIADCAPCLARVLPGDTNILWVERSKVFGRNQYRPARRKRQTTGIDDTVAIAGDALCRRSCDDEVGGAGMHREQTCRVSDILAPGSPVPDNAEEFFPHDL